MGIQLNHTIVAAADPAAEARWVADVLGLAAPVRFGPFHVVATDNEVSLDFMRDAHPVGQHYAFLVTEAEFDAVSARLAERGVVTWADPGHTEPGYNTHDGGRGRYFDSPSGHNLEILTRPYGSGSA